eukprot:9251206-Pyramimonas_sp.AAC.2
MSGNLAAEWTVPIRTLACEPSGKQETKFAQRPKQPRSCQSATATRLAMCSLRGTHTSRFHPGTRGAPLGGAQSSPVLRDQSSPVQSSPVQPWQTHSTWQASAGKYWQIKRAVANA